ncbi:hypothetical protein [Streptomyces sp. NPDC057002]|uniref:hypothetical protein n=1 Tax=Streptomyces sp. NPDC057002 TaxID=3345992 RepID=UPI0036348657
MLLHCAHARYVWNLAVEQHAHWRRDKAHHCPDGKRTGAPSFAEQCRQLTEARAASEWLRAGNQTVQAQALKDFAGPRPRVSRPGSVNRPGARSSCTRASVSSATIVSPSSSRTADR